MDESKIKLLLSSSEEQNIVLGASLAESILNWPLKTTLDVIIDNVNEEQFIDSQDQEEICKMCEEEILGCGRCSIHFMCEGCKCEEANEMFIEYYFENLIS